MVDVAELVVVVVVVVAAAVVMVVVVVVDDWIGNWFKKEKLKLTGRTGNIEVDNHIFRDTVSY